MNSFSPLCHYSYRSLKVKSTEKMTETSSILYLKNEKLRLEQKAHRLKSELISLEEDIQGITLAIKYLEKQEPSQETLHENRFAQMTMIQAAEAFLIEQQRPYPSKGIVKGLLEGGFKTQSKDFRNTLISAMGRRRDMFVRTDDYQWDLVSRKNALE